jgi:hypothetical protein
MPAVICSSPCRTRMLTISKMKGCRRRKHNRSLASQTVFSTSTIAGPYCFGLPRLLSALGGSVLCSSLMAALRCNTVICVNSFSILLLTAFDDLKYLPFNSRAYSNLLRRVTLPCLGNTNFDATIPLLVTFIMAQCETLDFVSSHVIICRLEKKCRGSHVVHFTSFIMATYSRRG